MLEWEKSPHRRLNPLTGEWVLVSPHRAERPWQGAVEKPSTAPPVIYDPSCYLCPGNLRANGQRNPQYQGTFAFNNDFPALLSEAPLVGLNEAGLKVAIPERGVCRVLCFSPRHDLSLPSMDSEALTRVVQGWRDESQALRDVSFINYVQIFENRGQMMGTSNPHPHCQIWAVEHVPNEILREDARQTEYQQRNSSCLLCDYARIERGRERIVCENDSFLALVPFWAVWPFETIVIPKRHCPLLTMLTAQESIDLGAVLQNVTQRYDKLFDALFPYSMGFHEQPKTAPSSSNAWHFHAHFYPPLLRSATVRKFMVGFELLAGPQRDITAEMAAKRLRDVWS